jgi:predicted transcriptional regulator
MVDVEKIAERIDHAIAAPITINGEAGGVALETMGQMMEFAKLMSISGAAVPKYLRGNPGACLAICSRAMRWGMDPFAVAEQSYMVMNKGEEHVAYMSQLVHAVVESRAPLTGRLRHEIIGEGDDRRCKVWGTFKGEDAPHEYTSLTLKDFQGGRRVNKDTGNKSGSPLWDSNPEVQMYYSATRQWARMFCPDVLLGVYALDELDDATIVDVTPPSEVVSDLAQRLRDAKIANADQRGHDAAHVTTTIEGQVDTPQTVAAKATQASKVMHKAAAAVKGKRR